MTESSGLRRLSKLALERRRKGLVELLPPAAETLRGTLRERYVTCGKPGCKCARGERHGPLVSERNPGKRSHGRGSDRCRAGRARPPLDRELSPDQGTRNIWKRFPRSIANCCGGSACQREDSRTAAYNLVHDHPEFWAGLFHSFEIV